MIVYVLVSRNFETLRSPEPKLSSKVSDDEGHCHPHAFPNWHIHFALYK